MGLPLKMPSKGGGDAGPLAVVAAGSRGTNGGASFRAGAVERLATRRPRIRTGKLSSSVAVTEVGITSSGNSDRLPSLGATCGAGAPTLLRPGCAAQLPKRSAKFAGASEAGAAGSATKLATGAGLNGLKNGVLGRSGAIPPFRDAFSSTPEKISAARLESSRYGCGSYLAGSMVFALLT